jgi:hypothetical protein
MGVRFARLGDDVHPELACDVDDGGVLAQAMHVEPGHGAVARMRRGALEERAPDAESALSVEHRQPELGVVVLECEVSHADEDETQVVTPKTVSRSKSIRSTYWTMPSLESDDPNRRRRSSGDNLRSVRRAPHARAR